MRRSRLHRRSSRRTAARCRAGCNGQGTWGGFDWLRHETSEQDLAAWTRMGASVGLRAARVPRTRHRRPRRRPSRIWSRARPERVLGPAPRRIGRAPKRLLAYRTAEPFGRIRLWFKAPRQRAHSSGRAARRRPAVRRRRHPSRHPAAVRVGSRSDGGRRRRAHRDRPCQSRGLLRRARGSARAARLRGGRAGRRRRRQRPTAAGSTRTGCAATSTGSPPRSR